MWSIINCKQCSASYFLFWEHILYLFPLWSNLIYIPVNHMTVMGSLQSDNSELPPRSTSIALNPRTLHLSHLITKPKMWLCTQQRLRSAWASTQSDQSSLSTWRKFGSLAIHWAHSKDSDQTGRMPRLICLCWGHSHSVEVAHLSLPQSFVKQVFM